MFSSATPSARTSMASTVTPRPSKTTALRSTPRIVMWSLSFGTSTPPGYVPRSSRMRSPGALAVTAAWRVATSCGTRMTRRPSAAAGRGVSSAIASAGKSQRAAMVRDLTSTTPPRLVYPAEAPLVPGRFRAIDRRREGGGDAIPWMIRLAAQGVETMDGSGPPPFDGITETPYETPTAEELAQLEELGPQWYAEAGLESGAEAATTVGTDAAV